MNAIFAGDTKKLIELFTDDYKGYYENEELTKDFILKNYTHTIADVTVKDISMDANIYCNAEFEAVTAINCDTELTLKSLNSNVPAFLRIKNHTPYKLTAYWINYDGSRDTSTDQIRPIEAGKYIDEYTFLTHPFIVIDENNKCYGIYEATTEPLLAVIKDYLLREYV